MDLGNSLVNYGKLLDTSTSRRIVSRYYYFTIIIFYHTIAPQGDALQQGTEAPDCIATGV